jgi:plastocyanin
MIVLKTTIELDLWVMKISKRTRTLLVSISAPLLFLMAFVVVVVAYNDFHKPPEVDVATTGFAPQQAEINEGESIRFVNRSSTVTQFLCLGTNRQCDSVAFRTLQLPPIVLRSPGVRIPPGQAKDIIFDADGTFHITSTVDPNVNMTVTVNATS